MNAVRTLLLALATFVGPMIVLAADVVGTWKWSLPPSGVTPVEVTLLVEPGDGTHTATYTETGKDPISVTVRLSGDSVSFTVEESSLGKAQYLGRLEDDTIDGLITVVQRAEATAEGLSWRATRALIESVAPTP